MHRPARTLERGGWAWLIGCLLLCAVWPAGLAQINPAEVTQLRVERIEEGILLSAAVQFELPPAVDDALAKGIPMYFVAEATIYRDRWYWYDKRVASAARHMRLAYQPLTRRWRLQISPQPIGNSGLILGQMFDTREEALQAVQRVSRWRIADADDVEPDATHNIDFRFRLDVSQLPRPFQIGAVGQSEWIILAVRNQRLVVEPHR
jgi:Domain of unknown function (DUF4390)